MKQNKMKWADTLKTPGVYNIDLYDGIFVLVIWYATASEKEKHFKTSLLFLSPFLFHFDLQNTVSHSRCPIFIHPFLNEYFSFQQVASARFNTKYVSFCYFFGNMSHSN